MRENRSRAWLRASAVAAVTILTLPIPRVEAASLRRTDPAPLPADAVLHTVDGAAAGDWFGWAVCALGDVDGDTVPDFAVGAIQNENLGVRPAPHAPPGYVHVYSGATGARMYALTTRGSKNIDGTDDHFGHAMTSIRDQDGDGARDLVVGAYLHDGGDDDPFSIDENTGGVFVFSGRNGEFLRRLPGARWGDRFGYALATIEDLDGDGERDLIVGVEKADKYAENEGRIDVLSSRTFELLARAYGPGHNAHLGSAVAEVGDVDGDGVPDYAGGAFMFIHDGPGYADPGGDEPFALSENDPYAEAGRASVFSGRTGAELQLWVGDAKRDHLGCALADLRGGAETVLAVGASQSGWAGDFYGPGYVRFFGCRSGARVGELRGEFEGQQFGWTVTNVGDRDGDGHDDLLVGAPDAISVHESIQSDRPGRVYLYSGADRRLLKVIVGASTNDRFGTSAALVGDLDGDGHQEVLIGAPENVIGQTRAGYAVVVSGRYLDS